MTTLPTPEQTRRLDVSTHPIRLADGNAWGFARPSPRLRPVLVAIRDEVGRPGGSIAVQAVVGYPPAIQRLVDTLRFALEEGSDAEQHEALFNLAGAMLLLGHDIDPATAADLLAVDAGALARLAGEVVTIAFGGHLETPRHPHPEEDQ